MNITVIILTAVMLLTLAAPFVVTYSISLAKKGLLHRHRKINLITFFICVVSVLLLEGLIRVSGGSGSLAGMSDYADSGSFKHMLIAHITGAVLTYMLWTWQIVASNRRFQKILPGKFSRPHKNLGYVIFAGLIFTAITALIIYLMTMNLI